MYAMLKSYLTIASTNIIQYKGYSSINVISKEFLLNFPFIRKRKRVKIEIIMNQKPGERI